MSGGASLPSNPTSAYQLPNQSQADSGALGGTNNINSQAQGINSAYNSQGGLAASNTLLGQVSPYTNAANTALNTTAFNPAQYAQEYQQQQDQTNSTLA